MIKAPSKLETTKRLAYIFEALSEIFKTYKPQEMAIEQIFGNSNIPTTLKLGMARGTALLVAGLNDIPFFEYFPNQIKKTVTGAGHADKEQMMKMIEILLKPKQQLCFDTSDALAIALCHVRIPPSLRS